jgi:hypothetical protein
VRRLATLLPLLALGLIAAGRGWAQEEPPARVGRISFVSGQLAFHMPGETAWSAAAVNYPVATGGTFWTDPQSRAEIRIGSQTIDITGNTEVDIVQLNEQVVQIAVPQGRVDLHLRSLEEGNTVEIDIPRGGVWLLQPGVYDIDAGAQDHPSRVAVFDGSAHFVGGSVDVGLNVGDVAVLTGSDPVVATIDRAAPDAFVQWCRSRDYQPQRLAAPYYLSPRMTGYEELDEYGAWRAVPDYGEAWFPSAVPTDWAPYREGHWAWIQPWGWSWIGSAPWGFAPFHYGRWARIEGRWAWIPGRFVPQPVYAPALVAFIGDPGGGLAGVGRAGPAVGWFPLGPDEVYWPSYTRNPAYIRNLNITNVSEAKIANVTNAIASQRTADPPPQIVTQTFVNRPAATVVPVRVFANATSVAPAVVRVPPQTLQQASISVRPPELKPATAHDAPAGRPGAPTAPGLAPARVAHPPATPTSAAPVPMPGARQPGGHPATQVTLPPPIQHSAPPSRAAASPAAAHPVPPVRPAAPPAVAHIPPPAPHPVAAPAPLHHAASPPAPHPAPAPAAAPRGGPPPQAGKPPPHGKPGEEEHK